MKILIAIPTLNEEKTICNTLTRLATAKLMLQTDTTVLICDGFSTDGTLGVIRKWNELLRHDIRFIFAQTYGDSIYSAFVLGKAMGVDYVIIMDSESHDPIEMYTTLSYINTTKLLVAGTRTKYHAKTIRKIITVLARAYVHFLFQVGIVDVTSGFRAYPLHFVKIASKKTELFNAPNYVVNVNLAIEAQRQDCKIYNFPMSYLGGNSNLTIRKFLKSLMWGVKLWMRR